MWKECTIFIIKCSKILFIHLKAVLAARSRVFQKMLYQAPSPQRKKEPPPRENKLRLFLKRSSEPLLNLQNAAQQVNFYLNIAPNFTNEMMKDQKLKVNYDVKQTLGLGLYHNIFH